MKEVWKYPLEVTDETVIEMPWNAEVLTVQVQHGTPCIWALVEKDNTTKQLRKFRIIGTGHEIGDSFDLRNLKYIGTYQLEDGYFIGHVFEVLPPEEVSYEVDSPY